MLLYLFIALLASICGICLSVYTSHIATSYHNYLVKGEKFVFSFLVIASVVLAGFQYIKESNSELSSFIIDSREEIKILSNEIEKIIQDSRYNIDFFNKLVACNKENELNEFMVKYINDIKLSIIKVEEKRNKILTKINDLKNKRYFSNKSYKSLQSLNNEDNALDKRVKTAKEIITQGEGEILYKQPQGDVDQKSTSPDSSATPTPFAPPPSVNTESKPSEVKDFPYKTGGTSVIPRGDSETHSSSAEKSGSMSNNTSIQQNQAATQQSQSNNSGQGIDSVNSSSQTKSQLQVPFELNISTRETGNEEQGKN